MNDRIILILKYKNISATKFADEIDVQRSSISHILSERNKPSLEFIQKILKTYPEISPEWLISGKGSMVKNPDLFAQDENVVLKEAVKDKQIQLPPEVKTSQKEVEIQKPDISDFHSLKEEAVGKENIKPTQTTLHKKNIEKILVFYTDSTFKEYFPQKED